MPVQLNQYQAQFAVQAAATLIQQSTSFGPNDKAWLLQTVLPQYQGYLLQALQQALPPHVFAADGSVHQNDFYATLRPIVNSVIEDAVRRTQAQAQPAYPQPGYGQAQPYGQPMLGAGLFGAAVAPAASIGAHYDTGTTRAAQQPAQPAWPPQAAASQSTQPPAGAQPMTATTTVSPVTCELAPQNEGALTPPPDFIGVRNQKQGAYEQQRVTTAEIDLRMAFNSPLQAFQEFYTGMPGDRLRGLWAYIITYTQLQRLDLATASFERMREAMAKAYGPNKPGDWAAALKVLASQTRAEEEVLNQAMTHRFNELLRHRLRSTGEISTEISLDQIGELAELMAPTCSISLVQRPNAGPVVIDIIDRVFREFITEPDLAGAHGRHIGDLIQCRGVQYFHHTSDDKGEHTTTKFDYGALTKTDGQAIVSSLLERYTVLRARRVFLATNAAPEGVLRGLLGTPNLVRVSDGGILQPMIRELTQKREQPEMALLLQGHTHPKDFLTTADFNMAMEGDQFLTLNRRTLGW